MKRKEKRYKTAERTKIIFIFRSEQKYFVQKVISFYVIS